MHYSMRTLASVFIITTVAATTNVAAETRRADAHVHGVGQMNFAIEGRHIHLELRAPGFDILGFESLSSDKQRQQLHQALARLKQSALWSLPDSAGCTMVEAESHVVGHDDHQKEGDHKHNHKSDSHQHDHHREDHHQHAHHKENAHKHEHDRHHDKHKSEEHIDIRATYVYQCRRIDQINRITTNYFKTFTSSEKLTVQGITANKQVSGTLTPQQPEIKF